MNTPILTERTCLTCKHKVIEKQGAAKQMFCRRNPPQVTVLIVPGPGGPVPTPVSSFPPVQPEMSCGEWGPRVLHANASALEPA